MAVDKSKIIIDKIAFEYDEKEFHFRGTYLNEPKGMALVEISQNGHTVREFLFPAYKIWNIAAHTEDIVSGLLQGADNGLYIAGSDGLGGNVYRSK